MQPSRRAFLLGRRPRPSDWEMLTLRLARVAEGRVEQIDEGCARLRAASVADVRRARALCAEHGAVLALDGVPCAAAGRPVLRIDPAALDTLSRLGGRWHAGPGCRVGRLLEAGLTQFQGADPGLTVAAWLAGPHRYPAGATADSGVHEVDVLLADGTIEVLGPFGAADQRPLASATTQRLVPALFQLAGGADAAACLARRRWPARYRLDALRPAGGAVNLAHLLLGHGGALAWVEGLSLHAMPAPAADADVDVDARDGHDEPDAPVRAAAARLDGAVVGLFDPQGVYAAPAGQRQAAEVR